MGENAVHPVCAAIRSAIHDAIGVRIHDLPITPERVLRAMLGDGGQGSGDSGTADGRRGGDG